MAKDEVFLLEIMKHRHPASSNFLAVLLFIVLPFGASRAAAVKDTLFSGECISASQKLMSKTGIFELGLFANTFYYHQPYSWGIRYKSLVEKSPVFFVGDDNYLSNYSRLCFLEGKLYIEDEEWSYDYDLWPPDSDSDSQRNGSVASVAILLDTGNFVVRDEVNPSVAMWQSFDYLSTSDVLQPGAWTALDTDTGASLMTGETYDYPPRNCTLVIDKSRKRGFAINIGCGSYLGTFPEWMVAYKENASSIQLNVPKSPNDIEFLKLDFGQVSLLRWLGNGTFGAWQPLWSFPSSCNASPFICGAFGACTHAGTCRCIEGFKPTLADEWELGRFASGCSSIHPLECENGYTNDSFVLLNNLRGLPDYAHNEPAASSDECKSACLSNCYCTAYSYSSGCKIWPFKLHNLSLADNPTYNSIYVRVGSAEKKRLYTRGIVALGIVLLVAITVTGSLIFWLYKILSSRQMNVEGFLVVYSYAQLKKATGNFCCKLGEGGFGSVFKGMIVGSTPVAVKNLKCFRYGEKQFRTEVQTIGMIQQTNLVRLLGFCAEGTRRLLVYEYMSNGSLDAHLFSDSSSALSWNLRYQIAVGIAKGLAYLHEECNDCIIHCDIKPENILLNAEFCPKIADFGMAKLVKRDYNGALTTFRGTIGYLAPEWLSGQAVTYKVDVYSFGIVLFEIISGRRTSTKMRFGDHSYFPSYAAAQVNEGEVLCLLDGRLEGNANVKELEVACRVACWCIQDDEDHRPSMGQVVRMLEGAVHPEVPPIPASFQNLMSYDDSGIYSAELPGSSK
ncbi:unnamed protein product [Urochloa decumbens]|uniref:Receptor-like serine/threonine-protein kinase n=1 Tax=Urochloa decumbens TaxID=240449 RepID=A0ABC8ZEV4_9POAL